MIMEKYESELIKSSVFRKSRSESHKRRLLLSDHLVEAPTTLEQQEFNMLRRKIDDITLIEEVWFVKNA
jgi:hypothetical protein